MAQQFRRNIITFILLHSAFALILLIGLSLAGDITMEMFAYLFWFLIIFGTLATFIQAAFFTVFFSKVRLSSFVFFFTAFTVELILVNILTAFDGGGNTLTGDLIRKLVDEEKGRGVPAPLFIHIAFLIATVLIAFTRKHERAVSM